MIPESILGRLIHASGVNDRLLVQFDVLSVYLLQHLSDTGMLKHMCFKGGISLRKVFARVPSRFSRDVDFVDASYQDPSDSGMQADEYYYAILEGFDEKIIHDILWKVKSIANEDLHTESLRVDLHFFIYDDQPTEGWENRLDNVLSIEECLASKSQLKQEPCLGAKVKASQDGWLPQRRMQRGEIFDGYLSAKILTGAGKTFSRARSARLAAILVLKPGNEREQAVNIAENTRFGYS